MKTISDLIGGIKASQGEIALALATGKAPTWEAYHRMVGQHQGLEDALEILNNLLREDDEHE
jgi:hypothetical protein